MQISRGRLAVTLPIWQGLFLMFLGGYAKNGKFYNTFLDPFIYDVYMNVESRKTKYVVRRRGNLLRNVERSVVFAILGRNACWEVI